MADDYQPPFPLWVARAGEDLTQVVMACFGVQHDGEERKAAAMAALRKIAELFKEPDGALHHDLTHHQDAQGCDNLMAAAARAQAA